MNLAPLSGNLVEMQQKNEAARQRKREVAKKKFQLLLGDAMPEDLMQRYGKSYAFSRARGSCRYLNGANAKAKDHIPEETKETND